MMKQIYSIFFILAAWAAFFASPAAAEMVKCEGVWTNRDCEGSRAKELDPWDTRTEEQKQRAYQQSKKRSLFHELTMKSIRIKREYGLDFSLEEVEEHCFQEAVSVEDCKERIAGMSDRIDAKTAQLALVKEQERANRLREEANKLQEEQNVIEASNPTVIVEERNFIVVPKRHRRRPPFRYHRAGPFGRKPFRHGGTRHSSRVAGGSAITVTGSGTIGGADISVRGSAGAASVESTESTTVKSFGSAQRSGGTTFSNFGSAKRGGGTTFSNFGSQGGSARSGRMRGRRR